VGLSGLAPWAGACALPQQMLAAPDDLADYRAFRVAAHEGRRLFQAQRYLERHPHGAFSEEVRAVFDREEAAWFEAAKTSRVRAKEYVVDLPDGPHAEAARSLMVLFDEHQEDTDTLTLLADARHTAATLDYETARRRRLGELILQEVGALLDSATWGASLDVPPPALAGVLRGAVPDTWGGERHARREDAIYFVIPTPQGSQSRGVEVGFQLWTTKGRVTQGAIAGEDLFIRWSEAVLVRVLDAGSASDRALAASTVAEVLAGAFEATLPASRCTSPTMSGDVLARACDGWAVTVHMGSGPGTGDTVDVHGPTPAPAAPPANGARPSGIR
jgi:hypothetical protein